MNIRVVTPNPMGNKKIVLRNILKYFPWELAHAGVYWIIYFESLHLETPLWIWILLIAPQIVVGIYFVSIILSGGRASLYDTISGTSIQVKDMHI